LFFSYEFKNNPNPHPSIFGRSIGQIQTQTLLTFPSHVGHVDVCVAGQGGLQVLQLVGFVERRFVEFVELLLPIVVLFGIGLAFEQ